MKIYEVTVTDKCSSPTGLAPAAYESYVAVGTDEEMKEYPRDGFLSDGFTDDDIHFYFHEDEFKPKDGEIETEEFKYLIGKRVA